MDKYNIYTDLRTIVVAADHRTPWVCGVARLCDGDTFRLDVGIKIAILRRFISPEGWDYEDLPFLGNLGVRLTDVVDVAFGIGQHIGAMDALRQPPRLWKFIEYSADNILLEPLSL